jgi:hypothetical protein
MRRLLHRFSWHADQFYVEWPAGRFYTPQKTPTKGAVQAEYSQDKEPSFSPQPPRKLNNSSPLNSGVKR